MTIRTHKANDTDDTIYVAYTYVPTIAYKPYGMLYTSAPTRMEAITKLLNLLNN